MNPERFDTITARYPHLRIAVVGDFCLDRYLEIDPARQETSIETGLPVHNVVKVRAQPGGAGTILNNLVALGIGGLFPVGFCGEDGEGYELRRALDALRNVSTKHFLATSHRCTFTYTKPLLTRHGQPPAELNRLDIKNWTATPATAEGDIISALQSLAEQVDAVVLLDQVSVPETGVVTRKVLDAVKTIAQARPSLLIVGDSRCSLRSWPLAVFKMNAHELATLVGTASQLSIEEMKQAAAKLAGQQGRPVFVTLAERGILGATPNGEVEHVPALPVRGEIDIVGAGDAVTANLTVALAAGATLREALEIAAAAASIVIHQLGTTGTASVEQIRCLIPLSSS